MIEFIKDYILYLRERKKWFLIPVIIAVLIVGLLVVGTSGSALSPFVYTLF
jgi:hypothetical protein